MEMIYNPVNREYERIKKSDPPVWIDKSVILSQLKSVKTGLGEFVDEKLAKNSVKSLILHINELGDDVNVVENLTNLLHNLEWRFNYEFNEWGPEQMKAQELASVILHVLESLITDFSY
jgi:hypothetical protein